MFFSCFDKKRTKRNRLKGRFEQMQLIWYDCHWQSLNKLCVFVKSPLWLSSLVTFLFSDKKVTLSPFTAIIMLSAKRIARLAPGSPYFLNLMDRSL